MSFLQPSYLWGFLALAIPIAIHLWSKKKVRTIKVGSTKFIAETKSKRSNSIQINEWVLLLLRCLILSLLVLILAQAQSTKKEVTQEIAYIFEPSLLANEQSRALFNNIPLEGRHLFVKDFPEWQAGQDVPLPEEVPQYWQLAQQLDEVPADSVVVFVHAFAKALQGKRPTLNKKVNWVPVEVLTPSTVPFKAVQKKDRIALTTVERDAHSLAFTKIEGTAKEFRLNTSKDSLFLTTQSGTISLPLAQASLVKVALVYDTKLDDQRLFIAAGLKAIATYTGQQIAIEELPATSEINLKNKTHLIWLSEQELPKTDLRSLVYEPDLLASQLIEEASQKKQHKLTRKLSPELVIEKKLVEQLAQWLLIDETLKEALTSIDQRVVSADQLSTKVSNDHTSREGMVSADLSDSLWVVLLLGIIGERLLAKYRTQ